MSAKTLKDRVNTATARWLNRVMYSKTATSTGKVLAYIIADKLNCVTLDSWPAQETIVRLLHRKTKKTAKRAALDLESQGFITIIRSTRRSFHRYPPVFSQIELDIISPPAGQKSSETMDTNVPQSSLNIQLRSDSTASMKSNRVVPSYKPAMRGAIEMKLAEKLGPDGFDILSRLGALDDAHVARLCRAFAEGAVGPRELAAARLAAKYLR